jgi:ferredoxin-NADP reductase/Na+-transporting NADH:ubiquinone oxidoreductase subunit NqrB
MYRNALKKIDTFLDRTTMYRLVLYVLSGLLIIAFVLTFFGLLPYSPIALAFSVTLILVVCWLVNLIFARVFKAHTNVESVYITGLILALIISPPLSGLTAFLSLAIWASVLAIASKYLLALRKKHIFNPVAFGVAVTAFALGGSASWWVATGYLLPFVLIGGVLIVRKLRRADLVWSFLIAAAVSIVATKIPGGTIIETANTFSGSIAATGANLLDLARRVILDTPFFFFAFIMLTEPLTTPPRRRERIAYGALVGLLFAPQLHIGSLYSTPELALLVGNIFSYLVSPKEKLLLTLRTKLKANVVGDVHDFVFSVSPQVAKRFTFRPGQYLEWTLAQKKPDNRGNRRYFTIASSPSELQVQHEIRMGVKFYPKASTFKQQLEQLEIGDQLIAGQLAGDFTMPKDITRKLVFLAGGIGITPFRSMIKEMLDRGERRPITLIYSARTAADLAYKDIFDQAVEQLGIKVIYVTGDALSDSSSRTARWVRAALVDVEMLTKEVPDYLDQIFYVSGPHVMVSAFEGILKTVGVHSDHIKTDFFPGFV